MIDKFNIVPAALSGLVQRYLDSSFKYFKLFELSS